MDRKKVEGRLEKEDFEEAWKNKGQRHEKHKDCEKVFVEKVLILF